MKACQVDPIQVIMLVCLNAIALAFGMESFAQACKLKEQYEELQQTVKQQNNLHLEDLNNAYREIRELKAEVASVKKGSVINYE